MDRDDLLQQIYDEQVRASAHIDALRQSVCKIDARLFGTDSHDGMIGRLAKISAQIKILWAALVALAATAVAAIVRAMVQP